MVQQGEVADGDRETNRSADIKAAAAILKRSVWMMKTDITPVMNTLFWVSWALFLFTMFQIGKYDDGPPENLRNAANVLKRHYEDDLDDPQLGRIWQDLDSRLDSYASGLEARRRDYRIQYWFALMFYPAVAAVSQVVRKNQRPNKSAMEKPDPVSS